MDTGSVTKLFFHSHYSLAVLAATMSLCCGPSQYSHFTQLHKDSSVTTMTEREFETWLPT